MVAARSFRALGAHGRQDAWRSRASTRFFALYISFRLTILDRQHLGVPRGDPVGGGQRLALRTMAVATRVVCDHLMTATVTLINMAAHSSGATFLNGPHHTTLLWQQRRAMCKPKGFSVLAKDVSDLQPNSAAHQDRASQVQVPDRPVDCGSRAQLLSRCVCSAVWC